MATEPATQNQWAMRRLLPWRDGTIWTLVTRNTRDFTDMDVALIDPWKTRRIFGVRAIIDPQALPPVVCLRRVGEWAD